MANVLMAAKQSTTSTLNVVTTAAETIESAVSAMGKYVSTVEVHADMYHRRTVRNMQIDEESAFERAKHSKAIDDASFYRSLDKQLEDPLLNEHYQRSIAKYNALK